jgi:hypothetical protein
MSCNTLSCDDNYRNVSHNACDDLHACLLRCICSLAFTLLGWVECSAALQAVDEAEGDAMRRESLAWLEQAATPRDLDTIMAKVSYSTACDSCAAPCLLSDALQYTHCQRSQHAVRCFLSLAHSLRRHPRSQCRARCRP